MLETYIFLDFCPVLTPNTMTVWKHSAQAGMLYFYKGTNRRHDAIQALCEAQGGNKVTYKIQGSFAFTKQWTTDNCEFRQSPYL